MARRGYPLHGPVFLDYSAGAGLRYGSGGRLFGHTLARALDIQEERRPDLLIIVMSATLDAAILEKYLRPCAVLNSEGRTFPVAVDYLQGGK